MVGKVHTNFHAKSGVCSSKNGRVIALVTKEDILGAGAAGGGGGTHSLQLIIQSKLHFSSFSRSLDNSKIIIHIYMDGANNDEFKDF